MNTFTLGICIFLFTYYLIITEKIPHTLSALLGGVLMVILKILPSEKAFHSIDLNVIFLLIGMMIIVHITSESGLFQWVAINIAKSVRGEPFPLMLLLMVITALFSALLDNVTTILLLGPVTILITEELKIDSIPFLIAEVIASNIGGTATLIGDPPNILIGSASKLTFNEFAINLSPIALIILVVTIINFKFIFGNKMKVSNVLKAKIMDIDASRALRDKNLMITSLSVLLFVFIGFLTHSITHIEPAFIAFGGAVVLMIVTKKDVEEIFKTIEWKTLFFFIGLFIMVEGIVEIGAIDILANRALTFTGGDLPKTSILILWMSAIISSVVDNIPYTATLIPMIKTGLIPNIATSHPEISLQVIRYSLWWALALGACLGGNGTLIGASANVVAAGIASKSGKNLSFMKFTKYGSLIMIESLLLSTLYLWFRFFR
ncbi:SLC13 family permease [Ilyobacter polytropus]|uniref:Possible tyrosine transporter P-protein n=1 Tax=Ilyobacter polytropus (strain ATCC 51220 / DSM 2926 / LMG 16218 / CuHBu1) TaxID=572544 RepID=E3HDT7_ILYPC|nr:ArsB/NhaD family transporter [Ilyobacter polytropus]ADO84273.1 possible tyrosine transporter P-protein [Ilyobacter polytropus DSM 2926]